MHLRGHPLWWRVQDGEDPPRWSASPTHWALAGGTGRPTGRGNCRGEPFSGDRFTAHGHPDPIDHRSEILGRRDGHDLVLAADPHRTRRASLLDVGEPNHRRAVERGVRTVRDDGDVVAIGKRCGRLRIDHGDLPSVAIQQPTERRCEESRPHRDQYMQGRLG